MREIIDRFLVKVTLLVEAIFSECHSFIPSIHLVVNS